MCMKYIIVYHGCSSKDKAKRLPSCTPTLNQVREYVDSDRWQLCNHPGSCDSDGVSFDRTYTFVEPYCSEACETFWEGTEAMLDDKDRLGYADFTLSGEDFPVEARFGHLRVDHERAMLLYNSLIDLTDKAAREVDPPIGFPITKSYPARQIVLFLMSEKSEAGNDVMAAFPGLTLEEKVQLLQRVMGGLSMSYQGLRTSSCESFHLFEAAGIRDDKQWQEYAHSIVPLYLPTSPPKPVSGEQARLRSMIDTWNTDGEDFEEEEEDATSANSLLASEYNRLQKEMASVVGKKMNNGTIGRWRGLRSDPGEQKKEESLFKGVDFDPNDPFPPHCWDGDKAATWEY